MKSTARWVVAIALFCSITTVGTAGLDAVRLRTAATPHHPQKTRKLCYVMSSTSGIPVPCERVFTPIPTTAIPLQVIGNH